MHEHAHKDTNIYPKRNLNLKRSKKDEEKTFTSQDSSPVLLSLAPTTNSCTLFTEQPGTTRPAPSFCHLSPCISALEVILPLTLHIFALSYSSSLNGQLRFSSMNPSTTPHTASTPTPPPPPPPGPGSDSCSWPCKLKCSLAVAYGGKNRKL